MTATTPRRITPEGYLVMPARANRAAWLAARRWREGVGYCIGSSDVPPIMGVKHTRPAREVWHEKRGELVDRDDEPKYWGRRLESVIADVWTERNRSVTRNVGLVANLERPWAQCTLDRMVTECPLDRATKGRCALEVKLRGYGTSRRWHADAPDDVLAQAMWQIIVTGYDHIHVAGLLVNTDYRQAVVRLETAVADYILETVAEWRERHLIDGQRPPFEPDKATAHAELDAMMHPDRVGEISVVEVGDVIDTAALMAAANAAGHRADQAKALLAEHAQGARTVTFANRAAYWYDPSPYDVVDKDRLAAEYPDAYAACVTSKTKWTLRIAKEYKETR